MTDAPSYLGQSQAIHVEVGDEDLVSVGPTNPGFYYPTYQGRGPTIRSDSRSPTMSEPLSLLFEGPHYLGRSPAIHVRGSTEPPPPPPGFDGCRPTCEGQVTETAVFIDLLARTTTPGWGTSDSGHTYSTVGDAGSVTPGDALLATFPAGSPTASQGQKTVVGGFRSPKGMPVEVVISFRYDGEENSSWGFVQNSLHPSVWQSPSATGTSGSGWSLAPNPSYFHYVLSVAVGTPTRTIRLIDHDGTGELSITSVSNPAGVVPAGGGPWLAPHTFFIAPGAYRMRIRMDDATGATSARVWAEADAEPTSWHVVSVAVPSSDAIQLTLLSSRGENGAAPSLPGGSTHVTYVAAWDAALDATEYCPDPEFCGLLPGSTGLVDPGGITSGPHSAPQSPAGSLSDGFGRVVPWNQTPGPGQDTGYDAFYQWGEADSGHQWWFTQGAGAQAPPPPNALSLDGSSFLVDSHHAGGIIGVGAMNPTVGEARDYKWFDYGWKLCDSGFEATIDVWFENYPTGILDHVQYNMGVSVASPFPLSGAGITCFYRVRRSTDTTQLFLGRGDTTLTFDVPTLTPGTWYRIKWQVDGPKCYSRAKIFPVGLEAGGWDGETKLVYSPVAHAAFSAGVSMSGGPFPSTARLDNPAVSQRLLTDHATVDEDVVAQIGPRQFKLKNSYMPGTIVAFVEHAGPPLLKYGRFQTWQNILEDDPVAGIFSFPSAISYTPAYDPLIELDTVITASYIVPPPGGGEDCSDPVVPDFLPTFRRQIGDPTTNLDSWICVLESGAMALDWQTRGAVKVWGGELVPYCGRTESEIYGVGTAPENVRLAWRHWDQVFEDRSGQTWADVVQCLDEGRAVVFLGDYDQLTLDERCQDDFVGNHGIVLLPPRADGRVVVGDPICHDWKTLPETSLQPYAEKFGEAVFGVHSPQPIMFGVSRPWS